MTTLIQYQDTTSRLLGVAGLVDMIGPNLVSVETPNQQNDHYVQSRNEVYAIADEVVQKCLNTALLDVTTDAANPQAATTVTLYKEPGFTAFIRYDPDVPETPYRVLRSQTAQTFHAPLYASRHDAQRAFDALVRPRLHARYVERSLSALIKFPDTSISTSIIPIPRDQS